MGRETILLTCCCMLVMLDCCGNAMVTLAVSSCVVFGLVVAWTIADLDNAKFCVLSEYVCACRSADVDNAEFDFVSGSGEK